MMFKIPVHEAKFSFLVIYRLFLVRKRTASDKSCTVKQSTHFILNDFCFSKTMPFVVSVETYGRAGQATDESMALAHCVLPI